MKNTTCVLLLLVSLSAIATLSQGRMLAQDKEEVQLGAAAAASAQPQDFFYDNPWIPDPVKQIAAPWVPYLGPIGYPPMTPAPPAAISCSPFLPPFLCAGNWGLPQPQPQPAPAPPVATPSPPASPSRPPAA